MKKVFALFLALVMMIGLLPMSVSAVDLEQNYRLRWDMGTTSNNPAYVEWHVETQSLQVTYTRTNNFFQLRDVENPDTEQKSKLYIKEGENWTEIPNVTSKIVGVADERSGTWRSEMYAGEAGYTGSPTYQTIFVQFFKDGQVFTFDGGVEYGVYFEIYTDGYPHGSMPDDIFGFGNPADYNAEPVEPSPEPVEPSPEPTEPQNVDLEVTVRDFKEDGILFESPVPYEKMTGMVSETLGADRKPVYNLQVWKDKYGDEVTQEMLTGLFNDVDGYNMSTKKTLTLEPRGSNWEITSSSMFPIDDELFGNEGNSHNYHFSIEIHSRFKYVQGAEFYFNGDDDIWVFFNNKLVIDLGGVSYSTSQTVKLDDIAVDLGIKVGDIVSFDMFYMERHLTGSNMNMRTNFEFLNLDASAWALPELQRADDLGLIPDSLKSADLTQDITRAEFAAVSVKVYEALAGTAALPAVSNPFTDTSDVEILKAFNLGVTNGKYDNGTRFAPDEGLNRQEAATMLTRVFKRVTLPGWTLSTDSQFTLPYEKPEPFADDASIDAWAKDSVYFMAANGIINGIGGGKFAPKNVTTEDEATGYANATREQALLIAVRLVENLGE